MHKSIFPVFSILFALAAGCSGNGIVRGKNDTGKLSEVDYDRLIAINRMQQENIDAREYAHHNLTGLALNEKSKAMGEKIAAPHCIKNGEIPEDDLNGQIHEQSINGNHCPIYWFRRRGWTVANKIMVVADRLVIEDENYRKNFTAMAVRSMEGSYSIIPEASGFRVFGTVKINEFQTTNYGRIEGGITVSHKNTNNEGGGSVILNLQGTNWVSSGTITWTLRRGAPTNINYRINNAKVDEAQFKDLFSSYELDKYMDNALKMK